MPIIVLLQFTHNWIRLPFLINTWSILQSVSPCNLQYDVPVVMAQFQKLSLFCTLPSEQLLSDHKFEQKAQPKSNI